MIINGERIFLREFAESDAEALYRLNGDPIVLKYTGDDPFDSIEAAGNFIRNYDHYKKYGFGRWVVVLKKGNVFLGWCGLKQHADFVDLGFRFAREFWNLGFATESARLSIQYAFGKLGIEELVGRVASQNLASIRVLEKLGMKYFKRGDCDGIPDSLYYRLLREDYYTRHTP